MSLGIESDGSDGSSDGVRAKGGRPDSWRPCTVDGKAPLASLWLKNNVILSFHVCVSLYFFIQQSLNTSVAIIFKLFSVLCKNKKCEKFYLPSFNGKKRKFERNTNIYI